MKSYTIRALILTAATSVAAYPQPNAAAVLGPNPNDPRFKQWSPPGPGDVRSPCPGLNTLANHGFINHNGKNLTVPALIEGLAAGMNMGADFSAAIGGAAILASPLAQALEGSFDLNYIDQHNFPIEHDASLSRRDAFFGNDYSFYQPNWNMVLSYYKGMTATSIATASKAKYSRVQNSMTTNPTFVYGPREFILSYGETALYLQTMGSSTTSGVAPLTYVNELFEHERLPYNMGWRPSTVPITLQTLGDMVLELYLANPQALPEGLTVTADTYKDLLEGVGPFEGLLGNATWST